MEVESLMTDDSRDSYDKFTKIFRKKVAQVFENRNQIFVPLQCQNKDDRRRPRARKNLPRALRNSATRDRKTDIGMATTRVK